MATGAAAAVVAARRKRGGYDAGGLLGKGRRTTAPTCARTLVKCLAPIPFNGMDSYDGGTSRVGLLESADSAVAFNAGGIIHCERIMQVDAKIRSLRSK